MCVRIISVLILAGCFISNLFAGEKAIFSGEWLFNESESVLDENGNAFLPYKLIISQSDSDMTVQKTFSMQNGEDMVSDNRMTLDGKECESEIWNSPRITTANWSATGDTLHIEIKITFNQNGEINETLLKEAWSLQDGGKRMVINHFSTSSWGERTITMAFDKQKSK
jgi:hypothetical protein